MTAIWRNDGTGWSLLAPEGFPDEAALHSLIEGAPQLLPLAGSPRLAVVGREVTLGSGSADLIAIEPNGRLAVIEIKLARNAEARRAIVAQVLAYAAYLKGLDVATLESRTLGRHLAQRGFDSLLGAAESASQEQALDRQAFSQGLSDSLRDGAFRLVLVLDSAPDELVKLVGYLESVTEKLIIDLVTVSSFSVGGSQIIVPQRVDPEQPDKEPRETVRAPQDEGQLFEGAADFVATFERAAPDQQPALRKLTEWAQTLERDGLIRLHAYRGKTGAMTLLPRLKADNVGLITIWHDNSGGYMQFWRSVFDRRAPGSIGKIEGIINGPIGQGNVTRLHSDELLDALTEAYREAALGRVSG